MLEFTDIHSFDVSAAELMRNFCDPAFLQRKYEALGRSQFELIKNHSLDEHRELHLRYLEPTSLEGMPDIARKFLKEQTAIAQVTHWDLSAARGSIQLRPDGPARMDAQLKIQNQVDGCELHFEWTIRVDLPLVGKKLEKGLMQSMQKKSLNDQDVTRRLLAER